LQLCQRLRNGNNLLLALKGYLQKWKMGDAVGNLVASYLGRSTRLTELPLGFYFIFRNQLSVKAFIL